MTFRNQHRAGRFTAARLLSMLLAGFFMLLSVATLVQPTKAAPPNDFVLSTFNPGAGEQVTCRLQAGTLTVGTIFFTPGDPSTPAGGIINGMNSNASAPTPSRSGAVGYNQILGQYLGLDEDTPVNYITAVSVTNDYEGNYNCARALTALQVVDPANSQSFVGSLITSEDAGSHCDVSIEVTDFATGSVRIPKLWSSPNEDCSNAANYNNITLTVGGLTPDFNRGASGGGPTPGGTGSGGTPTIDAYPVFQWVDIETIVRGRSLGGPSGLFETTETYKLTPSRWGSNDSLRYYMTTPTIPSRQQLLESSRSHIEDGRPCKPYIEFSVHGDRGNNSLDINLDDASTADIEDLRDTLNRGTYTGHFFDYKVSGAGCSNPDLDGNGTPDSSDERDISVISINNIRNWFEYYPKDGKAVILFDSVESNEANYARAYVRDPSDGSVLLLETQICAQTSMALRLSKDLSAVTTNELVTGTWEIGEPCSGSDFNPTVAIPIGVRVMAADAAAPTSPTGTQTGAPLGDENAPTCESKGLTLAWIVCPIVNALADGADYLYNQFIQPLLETDAINANNDEPMFKIWSQMRTIGNILLIIAMLVIVFGQSIGGGLFDAYTVKKVLPRILVSAILINLSIYIVAAVIDVTNILGRGMADLIYAPFQAATDGTDLFRLHIGSGAGVTIGLGLAATIAVVIAIGGAIIPFILLFILLPGLIAFVGVFLTLLLRMGILQFLIIVSPVALALYCIPNTDQFAKKWWSLLFKTAFVYPLVAIVFALADVLSVTMNLAVGDSNPALKVVGDIASIVLLILPMFLIPFAFKLIGGAAATLFGAISGVGTKGSEFLKGNVNDPNSLRNRVKQRAGGEFTRAQAKYADAGRELGAGRFSRFRGRLADKFGNVDARLATYTKQENELSEAMSSTGRDELRYAGAGYRIRAGQVAPTGTTTKDASGNTIAAPATSNKDRYFNSKGEEISSNTYHRAKQLYGNKMQAIGAQLEYSTRKAQNDQAIQNMRTAFAMNAIEGNWSEKEMKDIWAQSTYPHKDKWLSEWFSTPKPITDAAGNTVGVEFQDVGTNTASLDKMVNEQHRTKESFRASSLRAQDWHAQHNAMMDIQSRLYDPATRGSVTPEERNRYAKMLENLDTMARQARAGVGGLQYNPTSDEVIVSGANAEVQGVVQAMYKSRKFGVAALETAPGSGVYSGTERALYDLEAANNAGGGAAAIAAHTIATAKVSDDRSDIPTTVTL